MAFTLVVKITGLCVFRPRPDEKKPKAMDVLMITPCDHDGPHSGGHSKHADGIPHHLPRVFYDAAYDGPSSLPAGRYFRALPLEGAVLDLTKFRGRERQVGQIPHIVDLIPHTPTLPLNDALLPNLACRVTLPPGSVRSPAPSGPWELRQKQKGHKSKALQPAQKAAWHVVWTVHDINREAMTWKLDGLQRFADQRLVPLRPRHGMIKLLISNVVRAESTRRLLQGLKPSTARFHMPHFEAFRDLYAGLSGVLNPWPDLVYTGPLARPGPGGGAYTCVPSGGH